MYASDLNHPEARLEDKLRALFALGRGGRIELGFRQSFLDLLSAFNNPQLSLPPVIHVAGTNGKGSTIAFLRAILEAAGHKVHVFTSPHLVSFNERIVLAGQKITDEALEALIDEALEKNQGRDITFFEITTAMAFAAFARTPADIALIEVGLGGRLDCTNIIRAPLLSLITSISKDHTEFLGDTIESIAAEKGGIVKENTPVLIGHQNPETHKQVLRTLRAISKDKSAPFFAAGSHWRIETKMDHFCFENENHDLSLPLPALTGAHQIHNAALAIQAALMLSQPFKVTADHLKAGLQQVKWPARLQKLDAADYDLPDTFELWLDGGHNQEAGQTLAQQAQTWKKQDDRALFIITAMMKHKDAREFLAGLSSQAEAIYAVNIPGEPLSQSAQTIACALPSAHIQPDYQSALQAITQDHTNGRILICGSLYLAAHVLKDAQNSA